MPTPSLHWMSPVILSMYIFYMTRVMLTLTQLSFNSFMVSSPLLLYNVKLSFHYAAHLPLYPATAGDPDPPPPGACPLFAFAISFSCSHFSLYFTSVLCIF